MKEQLTANSLVLAHEWLEPTGGSENTFEQIVQTAPNARVVCLWNNAPERFPAAEESFLSRTPLRSSKALSLALMRRAWDSVALAGVDKVIASSHAMSHHLAGRAARLGIESYAYVYSPARYIWAPDLDARGQAFHARLARSTFRRIDQRGINSKVNYAGISEFVAERMRRSWGVNASVVYPPVDIERIKSVDDWSALLGDRDSSVLSTLPQDFVLGASRLVEYKRLDVAMTVGEKLSMPVVIAGDGPFAPQLRKRAESINVPVHFVGRVSDELLYSLYQRTQLFVFMAVEDFGIMPIEAMALGAPTLVRDIGGTREVVERLGGGVTADPAINGEALVEAARAAAGTPAPDRGIIESMFSMARFREDFAQFARL